MDEAIGKGGQDVHRIEGLTAISETTAVQQYMRTGALPFWVAGILMNQRVRQLDYETLLKDMFVSLSVTGRFAMGWLQNLDFSQLPTDLARYYQRAGATYRSPEGAQAIWETIPASTADERPGGAAGIPRLPRLESHRAPEPRRRWTAPARASSNWRR